MMELSGCPPPPPDQVLAWLEDFRASLPLVSRRSLGPAHAYLPDARSALERARREGDSAAKNPDAFVKDWIGAVAFRELLDRGGPLDDPWVIEQAADLCAEVLRARDRTYRSQYGELVEAAAAEAIGWLALLELAKRLWNGEEIRNPRAYLRRIIEGDVQKLVDAAMRQAQPGARAFHRLVKKREKQLQQARPDLEALERRALAAKLTREEQEVSAIFLERVAEESLDAIVDKAVEVPERVLNDGMVEEIDRLVEDPRLFTSIDRDAWARWKAVGFRGADIDWTGACSRHVGSQRLQALCRKLRRHLTDWR